MAKPEEDGCEPKSKPETAQASTIEDLGRLWDEGLASGPSRDSEEVFARVRSRLKARLTR